MAARKPAKILTPSELKGLKEEQNEITNTLKSLEVERVGSGTPAEQIDRGRLRAEAQRLGQAIESGTPKQLRGSTKDAMYNESKALAEKIQEGMCSRDEMRNPEKHSGAIGKHVEWEKRNKQNIERWKQIQRTLEHSDPTSSNIERLRRA